MRKIRKFWNKFHDTFLKSKKLNFISWLHGKFPERFCWTDCVGFAFSPQRFNLFKIERPIGCKIESETHESNACYCGQFVKGKCFQKLSNEEQEALRNI